MLLMNYVLTFEPVGSVLSAFRMSIVVPVVFGIYLWDEPMSSTQLGGLLLALVALGLMTPRSHGSEGFGGVKAFGFLGIICLWQGFSHTSLRSIHYNGLDDAFLHILTLTGATAGAVGTAVILLRRHRPQLPAVGLGVFIGAYNAVALCVILTALSKLPGTLFFPVLGCSVVLLDNLFAHFYWQERLTRPAIVGVGLAVAALALVI